MSLILRTCLCLSIAVNCMAKGGSFFNHLVSDYGQRSYYLVINIDSPNYKGKAVVENRILLLFLYRTQGIPQEKYEAFALNLLVHKSPLKTKVVKLERWGFRKLTRIKTVDDIAAKGREEFLKHYFAGREGRVIRAGLTEEEKNAIIEKLFEWQIATSNDDETGLLFYTEFQDVGVRPRLRTSPETRHAVVARRGDRELYSQWRF